MLEWIKENHDLLESIMWVLLLVPTLLWWKDAVLWVAVMSIYANAKTAHGAWKAGRAKRAAEENGS